MKSIELKIRIQEFELDLDSYQQFNDAFYEIKALSFLISSSELFDVIGSEKEEEEQDFMVFNSL